MKWLNTHPRALVNLVFIFIILGIFVYQLVRPIDVLTNWTVCVVSNSESDVCDEQSTEKKVYTPNRTLEFISSSTKLISAEGVTTRYIDCDATETQRAREIQLSSMIANRSPGQIPPKETSIVIPSMDEFNGLPRTCRIVFNICYNNVILWRDHCETTRTNDFIVQEETLDPEAIRLQIQELQNRIIELEKLIQTKQTGHSQPRARQAQPQTTPSTQTNNSNNTTTNNTTNNIVREQESTPAGPTSKPVELLGIPVCIPLVNICVER